MFKTDIARVTIFTFVLLTASGSRNMCGDLAIEFMPNWWRLCYLLAT